MSAKSARPVCKFHPKCNKETCTFAHPQQPNRRKPAQPSSPKQMASQPCHHFLRGSCAYGTGCRRSHEAATNNNDLGVNETDPTNPQQEGAKNPLQSGTSSPLVSEDEDNAVAVEDKSPCSFYLMTGQCDNGDECEFAHTKPGEQGTSKPKKFNRNLAFASVSKPPPAGSAAHCTSLNSKQQKSPTNLGSSSLDASDNADWAGPDEQGVEVINASGSDDHPTTRSFAPKYAVSNELPSPTVRAPLVNRAPTVQVSQPISLSEQVVIPESAHYPHISQVMLHWSQFADPLATAELPFCKLHAQDICPKAESCTFRHSLTVQEYFSLFRDPQPTLITLRRERDSIEAATTTIQPVIPPIIHSAPRTYPTPSVSPKISNLAPGRKAIAKECLYFPLGKCKNGDRCPYAHLQPPAPAETIPPESNEDDDWGPVHQKAKINKPCQFFNKLGYCRDGADCHYLHSQAAGASGLQSTLEADNEVDYRSNNDNKNYDDVWESERSENRSANTTGDAYKEGGEDDQAINEWDKAQDTTSWETAEEHRSGWENRSSQSSQTFSQSHSTNRPCYRFKQGTCRWGSSCKYAHDVEPRNRWEDRSATPNVQVTKSDDGSSSTRQEDSFGTNTHSARTPDFAETHDLEPWEKNSAEGEPQDPKQAEDSSRPQTSNDDNGWATPWAPAPEWTDVPPVKNKEYCLAYGQGYCGKGDTCRFRHADSYPNSTFSRNDEAAPSSTAENDTLPASTSIRREPDEPRIVSNIPDHTKLEKLIFNTGVSFGPTLAPVSIETLADSCGLRLSNLPSDMTIEGIHALVQPCAGTVLENTLRSSQCTASVQVDFANGEQARDAFDQLYLHENYQAGRKLIVSFTNAATICTLRLPAEKNTLKVSWPKPTLLGWIHYSTIKKAKEGAARLNGVIVKGRKVQVEFCAPSRRQIDNFAVKFCNLPPETTRDEIGQLCEGQTLITGFDSPIYRAISFETIKKVFLPFGAFTSERIPDSDSDEGPNSFAFITFHCEAIAEEVVTELISSKQSCIGDRPFDIKPVYFAPYRVTRRIFNAVRQEIERMKEEATTNYTVQYDELFGYYHIRLIASSLKYSEFVKANAGLCSLLQGEIAQSDDGNIIWDDYFKMPSSAKALQHILKSQPDSIIPDERTKRIRLFGSKADQKNAMEALLKLLSKVHAQRHEIIVPRGSMFSLVEQFETQQEKMGVNKVTFDVLGSKIIVRGTNEERSEVQNLVDSLDSPTEYSPGCCEVCHRQPDEPKILGCLHVYCTPCLRMAFKSASHAPLRCVAVTDSPSNDPGQCSAYIPYIDGILPSEERDRLLLSSLLAHVRESQDLFVCPSIDCKAVYRTGRQGLNLHCSRCGTDICSFCQTLAHIGLSCADMKRHISS